MSDESMKNWMREELGHQLAARDNKIATLQTQIETLHTQVDVRDKRIEALLRQPDMAQLGSPHLTRR